MYTRSLTVLFFISSVFTIGCDDVVHPETTDEPPALTADGSESHGEEVKEMGSVHNAPGEGSSMNLTDAPKMPVEAGQYCCSMCGPGEGKVLISCHDCRPNLSVNECADNREFWFQQRLEKLDCPGATTSNMSTGRVDCYGRQVQDDGWQVVPVPDH